MHHFVCGMNWIEGYYMIVKVKTETFWLSTYSMEMHSITSSSFIICLWGETFGLRTILFLYWDLFPPEYQGLTRICCHEYMLKSTFEPSGTLVLWGESICFCKFNTDFVPNWLNIIEWHSHAARYRSLIVVINTKDHVSCHQKYWLYYGYILYPTIVLKNTMPFLSVPSQL